MSVKLHEEPIAAADFRHAFRQFRQRVTGLVPFYIRPRERAVELFTKAMQPLVRFIDHPHRQLGDGLGGDFRAVDVMANQREVIARFDGELHVRAAAVTLRDRAHVEVVGEDEMFVEAELVAEKFPDDPWRKRCREIRVDVWEFDVRQHDRIKFRSECGVWEHVLL